MSKLPNDRDLRMRRALFALMMAGSTRKAAAEVGIADRTIAMWAASQRGKEILAELRGTMGAELGRELLSTARVAHDLLRKALEAGKIAPGQLPVTLGILCDKARALLGPAEPAKQGDVVVQVRFGGRRTTESADGSATAEEALGEIEVRRGQ